MLDEAQEIVAAALEHWDSQAAALAAARAGEDAGDCGAGVPDGVRG